MGRAALAAALVAPAALAAPKSTGAIGEGEFQVEGELGTLDQAAIDGRLATVSGAVNRCYAEGVEKLWYLGGRLEVKVRVRRDGAVKQVATLSPLGNYAVEKCILGVLGGLRFSPPVGGREAEFEYGWEFRPRATIKRWDNHDVDRGVRSRLGELGACDKGRPLPRGLKLTFFVLPGGKVGSVGVGAELPLGEGYAACVVARVSSWRFDDPLGVVARATWELPATGQNDSFQQVRP